MMNNPEFKRNIWLELSAHRLIAVPVLLGLIFYVAMQNENSAAISYTIAKSIFIIVTILWGSQLAFSSVSDELQNRTWDNQRLSALSPFKLVWGKLLGATAFAWYIGLLCLVMMLFTSQENIETSKFQIISGLVLGAMITQALAFVSALIAAKNNVAIPRGLNLLFIFVLVPILGRIIYISDQPTQAWYGQDFTYLGFVNVFLLIYTAWAWLASYRIMQAALQIKVKPWAMLSFVLFSAFYVLGFYNALTIGNFASLAFVFAVLMTYLGALTEKRDLASLRRCINPWIAKTPTKAFKDTPYFLILAVFCLIALPFTILDTEFSAFYSAKSLRAGQSFTIIGLMSMLLMTRDIGLLYYFSLSQKPQRAVMTTVFYLILLYVLFPLLLLKTLGFIFFPLILAPSVGQNGVPILVGLVHCLVVAGLLYRQHIDRKKSLAT
ncbi:MAG: hypothetical protein V4570_09265 [Pseudomonadota bacterium]